MGKTSATVKDRYNAKTYDEIKLRVYKGRKADIKKVASKQGESVNAFIVTAVNERVERLSDDAYCKKLYDDYKADGDKGEPVDIESFAQGLGVSLQ